MILTKLQEALGEINQQRAALDEVESQLRSMIAKLSGTPNVQVAHNPPATLAIHRHASAERDKIDEVADVLRAAGKPLHITDICARISATTGTTVVRTKVEPGLNRHISKTKRIRVAKFGPSIYGLPEWKQDHKTLFAESA